MIIITHVTINAFGKHRKKWIKWQAMTQVLYDALSSCRGFDAESSECSKGLLG